MAIVIEDGTGIVDANSYVTVAETVAYLSERGFTLPSGTYEPFLLRAMDALSSFNFCGTKYLDTNELQFPRKDCLNNLGVKYLVTEIPKSIKIGQIWLAHYISIGSNLDDAIQSQIVKNEKVGPLETEYDTTHQKAVQKFTIKNLPNAYNRLKHMMINVGNSGRVIRA